MSDPLRIGVAPCFFHPDPNRPIFTGKTLLYLEESLARWLMGGGAVPLMLPRPAHGVDVRALLAQIDGLVLQGGSDVAPPSYGESPLRPEWAGDEARDRYEIELIRACLEVGVPVLAVCRGVQILNVALGGTLYQDIGTQHEDALVHRDAERYDRLCHEIRFEPGSALADLYPGLTGGRVNSVHHQAIRELAPGLRIEARAEPDGVIEAVRYAPPDVIEAARYEPEDAGGHSPVDTVATGSRPAAVAPFVFGVQWHPEFQDPADERLLDPNRIRDLYLETVAGRRDR